ncbi:phosphatase PAP2 family protein [Chloroflexota bacterium]
MRERIANLISNIFNPFLVSLVLILVLSLQSTVNSSDALKWVLVSVVIGILPIFLTIVYLVYSRRLEGVLIVSRKQRTKIFIITGICAGIGGLLLPYLGAPITLVATFASGLIAAVIFMGVNFFWKISLHSAFLAAAATILIMLFGSVVAAISVLVPVVGWSRVELKHHSLAQVTAGALLSASIVFTVFTILM